MFEFRFSTLIKLLLVVCGIMGASDYLHQRDQLELEQVEAQTLGARIHEVLTMRQQEWKDIQNARTQLDALVKSEEELLRQSDLLDIKERRLTAEIKYLAESLMAAVEKVRASALGSIIPDLKLEGRPSLHNAKIFKITDDSISFLHEDGVANLRATTDELPSELVQKYDLGANSLRNRLQTLRAMISASGPSEN